jgi:hypothetical protein
MKARCSQHLGGFKGSSPTGKSHSAKIIKGIKKGNKYRIYARLSKHMDVLGETDISKCSVEEIAFIRKLQKPNHPLWNTNIGH